MGRFAGGVAGLAQPDGASATLFESLGGGFEKEFGGPAPQVADNDVDSLPGFGRKGLADLAVGLREVRDSGASYPETVTPAACMDTILQRKAPALQMHGTGLTNQAGGVTMRGLHPLTEWACGAAGSALPWHGRGRRFDPDQVHQDIQRRISDLRGTISARFGSNRGTKRARLIIT